MHDNSTYSFPVITNYLMTSMLTFNHAMPYKPCSCMNYYKHCRDDSVGCWLIVSSKQIALRLYSHTMQSSISFHIYPIIYLTSGNIITYKVLRNKHKQQFLIINLVITTLERLLIIEWIILKTLVNSDNTFFLRTNIGFPKKEIIYQWNYSISS